MTKEKEVEIDEPAQQRHLFLYLERDHKINLPTIASNLIISQHKIHER